jgi:hypothetical protein
MPREPGEFKEVFEIEDAECTAETEKALHVVSPSLENGKTWVPKSQISNDSEVFELGDKGTLVVSKWLAETSGWV